MTLENKTFTLKGVTAVAILGMFATAAIAWSSLVNRVSAVELALLEEKKTYSEIIEKQNANDITLAEIKTQLVGLNVTTTEIKARLFR